LANRATLTRNLDVGNKAIFNQNVDLNFVTAQRVVALTANSGWLENAAITRALVMVEDDLAVQVF
jgi:hypothetical protein